AYVAADGVVPPVVAVIHGVASHRDVLRRTQLNVGAGTHLAPERQRGRSRWRRVDVAAHSASQEVPYHGDFFGIAVGVVIQERHRERRGRVAAFLGEDDVAESRGGIVDVPAGVLIPDGVGLGAGVHRALGAIPLHEVIAGTEARTSDLHVTAG